MTRVNHEGRIRCQTGDRDRGIRQECCEFFHVLFGLSKFQLLSNLVLMKVVPIVKPPAFAVSLIFPG
jgi:hypothetical protein